MEALVLRVEEQHHRDLQEIHTGVHGIDERLTREEASKGALETRVAQLERAQRRHQDQLVKVQLHAKDLENWSCRQNLRLRGIPESTGPENLTETVRAIIYKVLDRDPPNIPRVSQGVQGARPQACRRGTAPQCHLPPTPLFSQGTDYESGMA